MNSATKSFMRQKLVNRLANWFSLGLFVFVLLFLCSCAAPVTKQVVTPINPFSLFLQPLPQEAHRLSFTIAKIVALNIDGQEFSLTSGTLALSADNLTGQQKRLLTATLPPGRYSGLRLMLTNTSLQGEEGAIDLLTPAEPIYVNYPFTIHNKQAQTLFLSLSADRLVTDGVFFTPQFFLWKPERMLANLKGFVSNSGSQSLTVFNKRTALVTDTILVGKNPKDLALDQRRRWLYVALAGEDMIAVVDVESGDILGQVSLRFGDEPTELALTASGKTLVVLNHGSESVSIIDTSSLFEKGRIRLTAEPGNIFVGIGEDRAFVTHVSDSALSVLDLQAQTVQLTARLEQAPVDGVISTDGQSIYLINDFSAELIDLDAASVTRQSKIFVGNGAISIKQDGSNGQLFIGKRSGEISVVDPRALIAIDRFPSLKGTVQDLTIDNEENAIFVVLPQLEQLVKIDLISKQILGRLILGTDSHAVVIMGER